MVVAGCVYLAITLLLFRNLLPVIATHLPADVGDPLLNTAILDWNSKRLPLTDAWWNFPAFAPVSGVTAFTEHLLLAYPVTSPIIWITGNPLLAYNVAFLLAWPLNGLSAYAFGRALTGSSAAAFVGGLAFALAPFKSVHLSHLQMLCAFGMPLVLLGLHRFVVEGRRRGLAWIAAGWLMTTFSNAYALVFFPIAIVLWLPWFGRGREWKRLAAAVGTLAVASMPAIPLLAGYHSRQLAYGMTRSYEEIKLFSADIAGVLGTSQYASLWGRVLPDVFSEGSLFPGVAILTLALVAAFAAPRRAIPTSSHDFPRIRRMVMQIGVLSALIAVWRFWTGPFGWHLGVIPLPAFEPFRLLTFSAVCLTGAAAASAWMRRGWATRDAAVFYSVALVVLWLFALGPEPMVFHYRALAYGPYQALLAIPAAQAIRAAARAWEPATLCLAALAAIGLRSLIVRYPARRAAIVAVASVMIVAEGWFSAPVVATPTPMVANVIPAGAMVLDLPATLLDANVAAEYRAVLADYRTLNGYSGFVPGHFFALVNMSKDRDSRLFDRYRKLGDLFVIVRARMREEDTGWVTQQPGAEHVASTVEWDLYRLPAVDGATAELPLPLPSPYRRAFQVP